MERFGNKPIAKLGVKIGLRGASGFLYSMSGASASISLAAYAISGQPLEALYNAGVSAAIDHTLGKFSGPLGRQLTDAVTTSAQTSLEGNKCG
jgi:hypothetical protein